ncbi:MAG: nickel-dependent lactate racemase, partial [Oligosphaeraceae bacterium]|nr:nickel-dependent lactate racemase [Oligosphaeraceae bacterium]
MIKVEVPYDQGKMSFSIPAAVFAGTYSPRISAEKPAESGAALVAKALAHPIGSPALAELARNRKSAVIIASDHTRPVPSKILMPALLQELRHANPEMDISILIATGCHRKPTALELEQKFGPAIMAREKIISHCCHRQADLGFMGFLPSGGELWLNKLALQTDLLLAEGFIEPHFFAGFSGGRKSVLPGIAGCKTVLANHCAKFIQSPFAKTGNLDHNPIHLDMLWAARQAKLAFCLNVVLNQDKQIVRAVAGDPQEAHQHGCAELRRLCEVAVPESEIVITSNGGYPLDQNIYQAVKGMTAAESVTATDGVIIMVAACRDGHGGEAFFQTLARADSPAQVLEELQNIPANRTMPDQWESQILARILQKHTVILVT